MLYDINAMRLTSAGLKQARTVKHRVKVVRTAATARLGRPGHEEITVVACHNRTQDIIRSAKYVVLDVDLGARKHTPVSRFQNTTKCDSIPDICSLWKRFQCQEC